LNNENPVSHLPDFLFLNMGTKNQYGLIGKNIAYSFSRNYFTEKFRKLELDNTYENFDIEDLSKFPDSIQNNPNLKGLNVTIPYKEAVIPYLDGLSETAQKIGAVNTIQIKNRKLTGHNTDYYGFQKSLEPLLKPNHKKALILGTGGASKAVAFALDTLGISYRFVSRTQQVNAVGYESLTKDVFNNHQIIINTTPIGTFPNTSDCPNIPYDMLTPSHIAFDLIYNPAETEFLKKAKSFGATTKNGLEMLELQAEKAWEIWNS
jgi:shikimate dehydrogenase